MSETKPKCHYLFDIRQRLSMDADYEYLIRFPNGTKVDKETFLSMDGNLHWDILWNSFYVTQLAMQTSVNGLQEQIKSLEKRLTELEN